MKNKILFGVIAIGLTCSVACTDPIELGDGALEMPTNSTSTKDSVFANAEYARQFLVGIYSLQYYGLPFLNTSRIQHVCNPYAGKVDALTDCWHMGWNGAAVYGQYYAGALTANVSRNDYLDGPLFSFLGEYQWKAIREAWTFINNIEITPEMSDAEKARLIAEARCLMVARFWDTFQHYGGIPILDHDLDISEVTAEFPRGTVEECVNFMVEQLNLAIAESNFPWVTSDPATMTGRWTKAGAMALKARILQFAASPLLNPKDGQPYYSGVSEDVKPYIMYTDASKYQARWDAFYQACKDFFDALAQNGYYELTMPEANTVNARRLAYRKGYFLEDSKEILHSVRQSGYDNFSSGRYCWHSWYTSGVPRNLYWPTQEYVEKFAWSDGSPFNYSNAFALVYDTVKYPEISIYEPGDSATTMKMTSGHPTTNPRSLNGMFTSGTESALSQYLINVQYNRDPRLYEECLVNSQRKNLDWATAAASGDIWEIWAGGSDALTGILTQTGMFGTGYGFNKYYLGDGSTSSGDNIRYQTQWVYLSLSEMYLNYAEALLMKSSPDVAEAVKMVDMVRGRVGLGSMSKAFASTSPCFSSRSTASAATTIFTTINGVQISEFMEEILNERVRELGLQDIRWFDMTRYKRTDWMTKQLHGLEMHRLKQNGRGNWVESDTQWRNDDKLTDASSKQPRFYTYQIVEIFQNSRAQWGKNPETDEIRKWLLSPFPQTEINKGYGLVQNPGWE